MNYLLRSFIVFLNVSLVLGANILVFLPLSFTSHTRAFKPLFKELALRGHNITFYTVAPFNEDIPNIKQIVVRDVLEDFMKQALTEDRDCGIGWKYILLIWEVGIMSAESLLTDPPIQDLFNSTDLSFDLILLETFFAHELFVVLGHKFNAPIINLHPFRADEWISDILRNPQPLSYVPNFRLPITDQMNFYERTVNTIYSLIQSMTGHYYYIPTLERIIKKHVKYPGSENLPGLLESMKNTSLTLFDGSPIVEYQSPSVPNFVSVGGIHILPSKKLPEDLEKFINESTNGIIYLSLGSKVKVSALPPEKLSVIIKVLGSLKQRILLKWEKDEKMPGQPPNILTSKWFPQQDILAHPKCHAFITHGGVHSVLEAAYFGVPIIGVPMMFDQESNLVFSVNKGFGQMVKLKDFSFEKFTTALHNVLHDPSYKKSVETLSKVIKDVPMKPLDTAVFWVEHVLRNKGAAHLQPAGVHLPWYQYYLLDVISTICIIVLISIFILYVLLKAMLRFILQLFILNSNKKNKLSKNKKE